MFVRVMLCIEILKQYVNVRERYIWRVQKYQNVECGEKKREKYLEDQKDVHIFATANKKNCIRNVAQLVAHYVRDVGVGRSSRLIPTEGDKQ